MTRQQKYYRRRSRSTREAETRVMSNDRVIDTQRNNQPDRGVARKSLTTPQVLGLLALALAHFFDWVSFLVMWARHGPVAEANPIVLRIEQSIGLSGLTLAKLATVAFAALLMFLLAPK